MWSFLWSFFSLYFLYRPFANAVLLCKVPVRWEMVAGKCTKHCYCLGLLLISIIVVTFVLITLKYLKQNIASWEHQLLTELKSTKGHPKNKWGGSGEMPAGSALRHVVLVYRLSKHALGVIICSV